MAEFDGERVVKEASPGPSAGGVKEKNIEFHFFIGHKKMEFFCFPPLKLEPTPKSLLSPLKHQNTKLH